MSGVEGVEGISQGRQKPQGVNPSIGQSLLHVLLMLCFSSKYTGVRRTCTHTYFLSLSSNLHSHYTVVTSYLSVHMLPNISRYDHTCALFFLHTAAL